MTPGSEHEARRASEADAGGGASDPNNSGIIRACDQCRIRKIRCDKESPCSNCRIANRHCSSTGAGQKPREARQRVLISTQYERKIDHIEERLGSIEKLLRELAHNTRNGLHVQTAAVPQHDAQRQHHVPPQSAQLSDSERSPSTTTVDHPHGASAASTPSAANNNNTNDQVDLSAFEGNSSLTAHTQFASQFLEHAVERTALNRALNPSMAAALSSLKQIVGLSQQRSSSSAIAPLPSTTTQNPSSPTSAPQRPPQGSGPSPAIRFANQRLIPRGGLRDLPMPPASAVIPVLREINETPPGTFTLISVCCFMAADHFAEACRRVFFALDDFSPATFIIVNAGLYYLFQEKAVTAETEAAAKEYATYYGFCRTNLETALAHLRFFQGASMEAIEALLLGASYAIEISRPSLAWQLNSTAAQLCQDLGYHRVVNPSPASATTTSTNAANRSQPLADKQALLFWFSYMLDRGLALRLGRAPTIQDFDITLPRTLGAAVNATETWKQVLQLWIAHADVQGRIYEKLYSPTSLAAPVANRVAVARGLADELRGISARQAALLMEEERKRRDVRDGGGWAEARKAAVGVMVMKSDQVSFLSSLTLVYRALPPGAGAGATTFTVECIETARMAMQTHEECMRLMGSNLWVAASYVHWTILYAPFVPFIVLFCHTIETSDTADLHRLRDFIGSLQPTCAVSEGIEKLHRLFSVLYNVAQLYVEAKSKTAPQHQHNDTDMTAPAVVGNEFDVYLSALGFMPDAAGGVGGVGGTMPIGGPLGLGTGSAEEAARYAAAGAMAVQQQQQQQQQHQANQLGDWFSGNRYMMGLLEEDLSQFHPHPNVWSGGGV